jgi:hypothetical protein
MRLADVRRRSEVMALASLGAVIVGGAPPGSPHEEGTLDRYIREDITTVKKLS